MTSLVDRHVGERIRHRRTMLGLTQEDLAGALGVSYQQVQKYETAANRISAGRLYQIARQLGVDIAFFFDGADAAVDNVAGIESPMPHGGRMRSTIDVAQHFSGITDTEVRAAIASLVKSLDERRKSQNSGR